MTTYTYDERTVSDLHKDARGFRPRDTFWNQWHLTTDDGRQAIWDSLQVELDRELEREKVAQARAVESFEARITQLMEVGARSRSMAIDWLLQSLDIDTTRVSRAYAHQELEWVMGLPYGYVKRAMAA
jgi:hypothetical protein